MLYATCRHQHNLLRQPELVTSVPCTQFLTELIFQLPRWFRSDSGPLSQGFAARGSHSRIFLALKISGEHDDQLIFFGDTLKRIGYSSAMKNEMEKMMTNSQIWGCSTGPLCLEVSWAVNQATISGHPRSRVSLVKLDIRHLAPFPSSSMVKTGCFWWISYEGHPTKMAKSLPFTNHNLSMILQPSMTPVWSGGISVAGHEFLHSS